MTKSHVDGLYYNIGHSGGIIVAPPYCGLGGPIVGITFNQYEVMTEGLELCSGAHDLVRECDENLTTNGSYYATPEQIREGQRRFRVKQLKKFFEEKQMKQRIRNVLALDFPALHRSGGLAFHQQFGSNKSKLIMISSEATIIELGRDLDDLGVEPAALFNFGNLQG